MRLIIKDLEIYLLLNFSVMQARNKLILEKEIQTFVF
jgi:hypothetical protein